VKKEQDKRESLRRLKLIEEEEEEEG